MFVCYKTTYHGDKIPRYYIGSTSLAKIESGYKGSVVSKKWRDVFKEEIKNNPDLFDVEVLTFHETREGALLKELELHLEYDVVKSPEFFNESTATPKGMFGRDVSGKNNPMFGRKHSDSSRNIMREKRGNEARYIPEHKHKEIIKKTHSGKHVSDETRKKLSESLRGREVSDETRKKLSESLKDKNTGHKRGPMLEETKKKISEANKGREISNETRKKISESNKGKTKGIHRKAARKGPLSDESKYKISQSLLGKNRGNYKESKCPHCGKEGRGGNMLRYHFNNCKKDNK